MRMYFWPRHQIALRVGRHFFGIRSRHMPELWSERVRAGWRVVYLPFGLRAFHRGEF